MDIIVQNAIQAQFESNEEFPVDFDIYWEWLGFSTKGNAKRSFLTSGFEEEVDYTVIINDKRVEGNNGGGSVRQEEIRLTIDCAKSFAMMVKTEKGKEVRKYYLECEKIAKSSVVTPVATTPTLPAVSPEERIKLAADTMLLFGMDLENPRFKQGYQDWIHQTLGIGVTPSLPGSVEERWRGGAERAEELGFGRVGADASLRVRLGNFLCRQTWDNEDRRREERICNGQNREIWIYRICDRFDDCIRAFFQMIAKKA